MLRCYYETRTAMLEKSGPELGQQALRVMARIDSMVDSSTTLRQPG